jgi:hypothetical protein
MIPAKCGRDRKRVFIRIVKMDPPEGGLSSGLVDGLKTVLSQTLRCPFEKISGGEAPCDLELTNADRIRKNAHKVSPLED